MLDICRPIILYNKQVPAKQETLKGQFIAFGEYDEISVENNVFRDEKKGDMLDLWLYLVKEARVLNGVYTCRILFAFRSEDTCRSEEKGACRIADKNFFERNDLPFFFLVMIQYKEAGVVTKIVGKHLEDVINAFSTEVEAISYLSLDSADIILLMKTKTYEQGRKIVNDLHNPKNSLKSSCGLKITLNYSYTVAGFSKEVLKQTKDFRPYESKLETVMFNMIEKSPGSIKLFYNNLKKKIQRDSLPVDICLYEKFGNDDEVIVWNHATWSELLPLYQESEGIMGDKNADFNNSVYSVATTILAERFSDEVDAEPSIKLWENICFGNGLFEDIPRDIVGTCKEFREFMKSKMSEVDFKKKEFMQQEKVEMTFGKALFELLNSLDKFERTDFTKYIFISIFEPLKQFIRLLYIEEEWTGDDSDTDLEFLNAINVLIQNSDSVNRNFFQTPGFNAEIHDVPVKLEAFYSSYIYWVTKLYNSMRPDHQDNEKHKYKFLLYPWAEKQTKSKVVFSKSVPGDRVILIKIPEQLLFNPRVLMVILGHEVGHYVGGYIRNREQRYYSMVKIAIHAAAQQLMDSPGLDVYKSDDALKEWKRIFEQEFEKKCEKKYQKFSQKHQKYSQYMKQELKDFLGEILVENSERFYHILLENYLKNQGRGINSKAPEYLGFQKYADENENALNRIQIDIAKARLDWNAAFADVIGKQEFLLGRAIDNVMDIFIEGYADLMSIMALDLEIRQYLGSFVEIMDDDVSCPLVIRICFVVESMRSYFQQEDDTEPENRWNDEWNQLKKELENDYSQMGKLVHIVDQIMFNFEDPYEDRIDIIDDTRNDYFIFRNKSVWKRIIYYFCECKERFEQCMKDEEKDEEISCSRRRKEICEIYSSICNRSSIESVIKVMEDSIYKYTRHIFKKPSQVMPERV